MAYAAMIKLISHLLHDTRLGKISWPAEGISIVGGPVWIWTVLFTRCPKCSSFWALEKL
jgi:hypothetical protein